MMDSLEQHVDERAEELKAIGTRIRRIRKQQQRTLQDVADTCRLSRSMVSKIETGAALPTVSTLSRIAEALGVPVAILLEDQEEDRTSFTSNERVHERGFIRTTKGYSFFLLAEHRLGKLFQPFLFEARKGQIRPGPMSHAGEEFVYVLDGEMEYRVGPTVYHLKPGDSLYFTSTYEHDLKPITDTVRFLAVFSEHQIGDPTGVDDE